MIIIDDCIINESAVSYINPDASNLIIEVCIPTGSLFFRYDNQDDLLEDYMRMKKVFENCSKSIEECTKGELIHDDNQ